MQQAGTSKSSYRIGMIVPSSNTTMETEIPELLHRQASNGQVDFTFHSSRLRLLQVTAEELQRMNASAGGAVDTLCDAQVDCFMYACLVAAMHGGKTSVLETGRLLADQARANGSEAPVITSAGALVTALQSLGARKVSMIAPYKKELTAKVAGTIREYGIEVLQTHSLEVADNVRVGRLDPEQLIRIAENMDLSQSEALILSACVQMPSLAVIAETERRIGIPVISAATASAYVLLQRLGIRPQIPCAGRLLLAA